jgi:glyoxylase-like metal-dependent hydrolase (beta-lactamase superfamily II)
MGTPSLRVVGRRTFLTWSGRGALAVAVLGMAGCGGSGGGGEPTSAGDDEKPASGGSAGLRWSRVDLGFVSAFVLVRGGKAAVVDTGVGGSADAIGKVLDSAGPGWGGVRHVVLTHRHPDHAGSVGDVMDRARRAVGYVGTADLSEVEAPRRLRPLEDGDDVFGLRVVATPGHTAGHVAVYDAGSRVLVAGDALTNTDGLAGSNPQFTEDEAAARATVVKLGGLTFETLLPGHGEPITSGASAQVRALGG